MLTATFAIPERKAVDVSKEMRISEGLGDAYETLRKRFDAAGGLIGASREAASAARKMQAIEAKFERLWRPHRQAVGPCGKCGGTRIPATMRGRRGLGCLKCWDFDAESPFKEGKPRKRIAST